MCRICRNRKGLTLLELLIAMSITVLVVGALGAVSNAVHSSAEYGERYGTATQHARVALERITRTVREATANEKFPGFLVVEEQSGFPDTLVVWNPTAVQRKPTQPTDPSGLPRFNELVIFAPDADEPNHLFEIRFSDIEDEWDLTKLSEIMHGPSANRVKLTELVRTGEPLVPRGAVRFERHLRDSDVQGIPGLRQARLRIELQLAAETGASGTQAIPFFGSAAVYYVKRQ
jgi:hypothetical protein